MKLPWRSRRSRDDELNEEIQGHLDMALRDRLARGEARENAEGTVRREFGNVAHVKEITRSTWGWNWVDSCVQQLRYAVRGLRHHPLFSLSIVATLALGIGMATSVFTLANAVLLRRLPVQGQDRVIALHLLSAEKSDHLPLDVAQFAQLQRVARTLEEVAGVDYYGGFSRQFQDGEQALTLKSGFVTGNFFNMLGSRPVLGRLLRPDDDAPGAAPVMVISYGLWQRQFDGDPHVIGRTLTMYDRQIRFTIVGVASPGLDVPAGADFWAGVVAFYSHRGGPSYALIDPLARLRPGATPAAASAEFASFGQREGFARNHGAAPYLKASADRLPEVVLGHVRPVLVALVIAVGLLLLIACTNVGNLLLLRAASRARELAVRRAFGASYGDIVWQLLTESLVLAAVGGMAGFGVAYAALRTLLALAPRELPRLDTVSLAGAPLMITASVTCLATLFFGVAPSLWAARGDLASSLRGDSRSVYETPRNRMAKQALVAWQVALAVVVLASAGVVGKSLMRLQSLNLGFEPAHLVILDLTFPIQDHDSVPRIRTLYDAMVQNIETTPGVVAATPVLVTPFSGTAGWDTRVFPEGMDPLDTAAQPWFNTELAGSNYFKAFGLSITQGRAFTNADREGSAPVAIVSAAVAQRFWPNKNPIGKHIRWGWAGVAATGFDTSWMIVGVVPETRYRALRTATPTIYFPVHQFSSGPSELAIRTNTDPATVIASARRAIATVAPDVVVWKARTMAQALAEPLAQPRLSALLFAVFGAAALVLAGIGLYSIMAAAVRQRTREIGIRIALGAIPAGLRMLVLRQALTVAGVGAAVGLVGAVASTRLLRALLFEVSPTDPVTLGAVTLLLLVVATLAASLPAWRAARVDPNIALRAD